MRCDNAHANWARIGVWGIVNEGNNCVKCREGGGDLSGGGQQVNNLLLLRSSRVVDADVDVDFELSVPVSLSIPMMLH